MAMSTPPVTPLLSSPARMGPSTPLKRGPRPPMDSPASTILLTPPYTPLHPATAETAETTKQFNRLSFGSALSTPSSLESDGEKISQDERLMSDNELSYYLPSRGDGVNDMYLHHTLNAPFEHMAYDRILSLWALFLLRHPLLSSHLRTAPKSYTSTSFISPHHSFLSSALDAAEDRFIYIRDCDAQVDIIDAYLNGPRTLSNDRLAMLVVSEKDQSAGQYEIMLCATHFLGDGMALHTFMNEFYTLLGSASTTIENLYDTIESTLRCEPARPIPVSLEDRLPRLGSGSRLAEMVGKVDNARNDARLVGGQSFPPSRTKRERRTAVPTFAYSEAETKAILGKCKTNGVTIAHAMFALCNLAWARRTDESARVNPCLIYSALNLRPNLLPAPSPSYFHLAVGYFNIVLPSLIPPTEEVPTSSLFWHRAKSTKAQTVKAVKSPFVVSRSRETNRIRRERAVKWAGIDDAEAEAQVKRQRDTAPEVGLGLAMKMEQRTVGKEVKPAPVPVAQPSNESPASLPPVNQKALMGLSMLGNLDGMYAHKAFGNIELHSLTTGSRQRAGGLLLFAYTFKGKLWMSLGYDVNGFEEGAIEGFWAEVQALVKEVML